MDVDSVFLLLQVCLGRTVEGLGHWVEFSRPSLPEFLQQILNLGTDRGCEDILVHRHPEDVAIQFLRWRRNLEIVSVS
jgi:hypothetical protein